MTTLKHAEYIDTLVIGGGQAGLAVGYQLQRQRVPFLIVDAHPRIGDSWRNRWDSLRLFTPAAFDGLAGMPFPAPANTFVTKDEMADYLQAYAARFALPVCSGVKVNRLWREGDRFHLQAGDEHLQSDNVVVAMANYQQPRTPAFAAELTPDIVQLHSSQYRNPSQLKAGGVLVVGVGNSGAEIAMELVRGHRTWLSGREPGVVPFRMEGLAARLILTRLLLGGVFHHVLTLDTPMGRRARGDGLKQTTPLIRVKPRDLVAAGVERVGRTVGARDGLPLLDDGRTLSEVANVIWSTGYAPGFEWIDLPIHGENGPMHERGVVASQPGLYFVGLHFQYALSSSMVHGVSRDAARVARAIAVSSVSRARPPERAGSLALDRRPAAW